MRLFFLQQLFTDEIVQAICWTLIHSLWQGLLLALICGLVIIFTRKSSSLLRYNLISILFFLFLAVTTFTFTSQLRLATKNVAEIGSVTPKLAGDQLVSRSNDMPSLVLTGQTYITKISSYLNEHASLVVAIWFIIFSARFVKLIADVGYAHRIRYYKTHAPSAFWKSKVEELAKQLQIKKRILLMESEIVKVPVMTGFFKPVILFPFSLMMQLPSEQVEAVLLHELAHIRRRDYLVNLAQSFAETIFFFNPGLLWISSLIREERENCCDDIAIHHTKNKKQFIHALVAFQEHTISNSGYALAFPGKKNQLLQRAKRILQNDNNTLNIMQKIFLTSGLVIAGLLTVVFAQNQKPKQIPAKPSTIAAKPKAPIAQINEITESPKEIMGAPEEIAAIEPVSKGIASVGPVAGVTSETKIYKDDTLPEYNTEDDFRGIIVRNVDGKKYEIVFIHGKVTELYIDNKRIPDEKISNYQTTIDKIITETKEERAKAKIDAERAYKAASAEKYRAESDKAAAERAKLAAEDSKMQLDRVLAQSAEQKEKAEYNKERADAEKLEAEAAKEKADKDKLMAEDLINGILDDLKSDGIIKDKKNAAFSLNKNAFTVNGVKQPASVFSKYKQKFLKNQNSNLNYSKSGTSTHISYQVDN